MRINICHLLDSENRCPSRDAYGFRRSLRGDGGGNDEPIACLDRRACRVFSRWL